jgi:two-component system, OmpR family, response regulator VicR
MLKGSKFSLYLEQIYIGGFGMDTEIRYGNFVINNDLNRVMANSKILHLTKREQDLFMLLLSNPDKVFSKNELLEKVWGYNYYGKTRAVDIQIRRLREKIEVDPSNPKYIKTKWGQGYYFVAIV